MYKTMVYKVCVWLMLVKIFFKDGDLLGAFNIYLRYTALL